MSEMSKAQGPPGGDPLDLTGAVGTEDDVLPGPPGGGEVGEESGEDVAPADSSSVGDADPAPGATPDPPGRVLEMDPDAGADPIDEADAEGMRPPGVGDSESGSDPMPDMSGTSG